MFEKNKTLERIARKLEGRGSIIELIFLMLAAIGFVMKSSKIYPGGIVLVISLSTLAMIYYILAYRPVKDEQSERLVVFSNKLSFWAYCIAMIGILFNIMHYPGSNMMLNVGLISVAFTLILNIYFSIKHPENKDITKIDLLRNIIIAGIVAWFYLSPQQDATNMINNENNANTEIAR